MSDEEFLNQELKNWKERAERAEAALRSEGANRYWEGRWRDAEAELEKLKASAGLS